MEKGHPSKPKGAHKRRLPWPVFHIFGVVTTLVGVWFGSYYFENIKDHFPDLITAQLWVYNKISHWEARTPRAKWVVGVEIDNSTFYNALHLNGEHDITDRSFLAHIIDNAVKAQATVIALDIDLTRETEDNDDPVRKQKNRALYDAIYRAQRAHIPVVLTFGFDTASMTPLDENIADPAEPNVEQAVPSHSNGLVAVTPTPESGRPLIVVPVCVDLNRIGADDPRAGLDRGAEDMRKVPLVHDGLRGGQLVACPSFALQVVDAFEKTTGISKLTRDQLQQWTTKGEFVYTAFLPQSDFRHVSAVKVYNGESDALAALHHRIVLIGGNRTERADSDTMVDYHDSAAGRMAGMYYHANYVEGLLDDRIRAPVAQWKAALVDVLLAALVMWLVWLLSGKRLGAQLAFLAGAFVAIGLAYVTFVNFGFVLDGFVMLLLLVLHTIYEHYLHLCQHAHAGGN